MIVNPELLKPVSNLTDEFRFDKLPTNQLHAIAKKGGEANTRSPHRHRFTPSETHRGGVIRGAQRTLQARRSQS